MEKPQATTEFALAPGGPVDRAQAHLKITTPDNLRLGRRALITALFAWTPMVVLVMLHPNRDADISFLHDLAVHTRFLVVIPLLVMMEGPIHQRSLLLVDHFRTSGLVPREKSADYEATVRKGRALIDSNAVELLLMLFAVVLIYSAMHGVLAEPSTFWFEASSTAPHALSPAGWWYTAVALPIFVFLMLRWLWRYLVWWWFLARVAKFDLRLSAGHPDCAGGLGFVSFNHTMFAFLTFSVGCAISAMAANRILYAGATLQSFKLAIIGIAAGAVILGVAPLLVFTPCLAAARRKGWWAYGRFGSDYVGKFEQKWFIERGAGDDVLGSGDIQSLADLGGTFERVVRMQPVLINRRLIFSFLIAAVGPMLPLLLTVMPLKEIISTVLKALI